MHIKFYKKNTERLKKMSKTINKEVYKVKFFEFTFANSVKSRILNRLYKTLSVVWGWDEELQERSLMFYIKSKIDSLLFDVEVAEAEINEVKRRFGSWGLRGHFEDWLKYRRYESMRFIEDSMGRGQTRELKERYLRNIRELQEKELLLDYWELIEEIVSQNTEEYEEALLEKKREIDAYNAEMDLSLKIFTVEYHGYNRWDGWECYERSEEEYIADNKHSRVYCSECEEWLDLDPVTSCVLRHHHSDKAYINITEKR